MKYHSRLLAFAISFLIIIAGIWYYLGQEKTQISQVSLTPGIMKLSSPAFEHNAAIPSKYTCDGDNVSPPLQISDVPAEAQSLALMVDDPDAPAGDWVHWLVWNMDPGTTEIPEAGVPAGVLGTTDFGTPGWGGPCPPSGSHRYFFRLFALETMLELGPSAGKAELETAMAEHIIDRAELVGRYERSQ